METIGDHEAAWAAGVFEGAATTMLGMRRGPRLQLKLNDRQTVKRFRDAVNTGTVYGPYGVRPYSHVWIADREEATLTAQALWPYLGDDTRERLQSLVTSRP